jgi:hypothetical protein
MAKLSQYSLVLKIASIAQRRDNQLSCQNGILLSMIKTVSELAVSAKVLSTLARDKGAILLQVHPSSGTRPRDWDRIMMTQYVRERPRERLFVSRKSFACQDLGYARRKGDCWGERRFCQGFYDEREGPVGPREVHCARKPHVLTCCLGPFGTGSDFP